MWGQSSGEESALDLELGVGADIGEKQLTEATTASIRIIMPNLGNYVLTELVPRAHRKDTNMGIASNQIAEAMLGTL